MGSITFFHVDGVLGLFLYDDGVDCAWTDAGINGQLEVKAGERRTVAIVAVRDEPLVAPSISEICRALVAKTVEKLGGIDILVIDAGRQQSREDISKVTSEDFDRTLKTNLYAMHWITQAAVPHLPAGASVITTASVQAYDPSAILLDCATTKAGIVAYTKALAKQLIEKGIRANVVAPGPFWTPLQSSGGQPPEKVMKFGSQGQFGRPGQPVETAPVYVLLASQDGSFITGEVYGVTGGAGVA